MQHKINVNSPHSHGEIVFRGGIFDRCVLLYAVNFDAFKSLAGRCLKSSDLNLMIDVLGCPFRLRWYVSITIIDCIVYILRNKKHIGIALFYKSSLTICCTIP